MAGRPKSELKEDAIELRRDKVQELIAQGHSQRQVANMLNVSRGTINFDMIYLRQKAKENIKKYVDEKLPEEYENCLIGINSINREAWAIAQNTEDNREKIQALGLAKECYSMKLDLLTNATVVSDVIRFVSEHNNKKEEVKDTASVEEVAKGEEETTNEVF